ncbi:MAG TPA: terminase gpA endonuclease subunit, partial [Longimicrobiales bacterium]|nr:terminase gpA endonuclease subunit [Longimicrobiales bacterium]
DAFTDLLGRTFPAPRGRELPIARFAVDTGHEDVAVIDWARRVGDRRVMLIKGDHWKNWKVIVGTPKKSETSFRGKRYGLLLWPVGGALIKQETYGFLRLDTPLDGEPYPPGFIHLPKVDDEVCKQMVAEDLVTKEGKGRFPVREWEKNRNRNEALDCRVYARAAAEQMGLGRMVAEAESPVKPKKTTTKPTRNDTPRRGGGGWLDNRRRGGWL